MSEKLDNLENKLNILTLDNLNLLKEKDKILKVNGYCDRLYTNGFIDGNKFFINKYNSECSPEIKLLIDKILLNKQHINYISKIIDNNYIEQRRNLLI